MAWIQQSAVVLFDLDKRSQRTIVERPHWSGDAGTPAVSPDGRSVLYRRWYSWGSKPADRQAMFMVDLDGSGNRRLTPWRLGGGDHPGFAPDGTILFRSFENDDTKQSDFWTVRPDGTQLVRPTSSQARPCCRPPTRQMATGSCMPPTASATTPTSS